MSKSWVYSFIILYYWLFILGMTSLYHHAPLPIKITKSLAVAPEEAEEEVASLALQRLNGTGSAVSPGAPPPPKALMDQAVGERLVSYHSVTCFVYLSLQQYIQYIYIYSIYIYTYTYIYMMCIYIQCIYISVYIYIHIYIYWGEAWGSPEHGGTLSLSLW